MVKLFSILVMVVLLAVLPAAWLVGTRPLPTRDGVIKMLSLSDAAVVNFDGRGVPYIQARNQQDLYKIQGYVVASDRLFQMDMLRRLAKGELSEIFGVGSIAADKLMRTIGFNRMAKDQVKRLSPELKQALDEYSEGVNKYISDNANRLPLEFTFLTYRPKPWMPEDTLAIVKYLDYMQDESWRLDDLRQRALDKLGPQLAGDLFGDNWSSTPNIQIALTKQLAAIAKVAYRFGVPKPCLGSSAWVVAPGRTDSGGAILACDKHDQLTKPNLWYLVSLSSPELHVAGATIPGVPGVVVGRNNDIAWGSCALKADVQDLFLEEFSQQFSDKYRTKNGWKTAMEITELIPVRLSRSLEHKVMITEHGPVLLKNASTAVSLAWTGAWERPSSLETIWQLNRAKDYEQFQSAIEYYSGSPANFIFADRFGNIASHAAGVIPVRDKNGQGTLLVPGFGDAGQWTSSIPFKALPASTNPKQKLLVSANQKPVSNAYPWMLGHQWLPPYRAYRAYALIVQNGKHAGQAQIGLPDISDIEGDFAAPLYELVRAEIHKSVESNQVIDQKALSSLNLLDHWDGQLRPDSPEAAIYESFIYTLARRMVEPKLGHDLTADYFQNWPMWICFAEQFLHNHQEKWLPPDERTYSNFIATTFVQALKDLRVTTRANDPEKWNWKVFHRATFAQVGNQSLNWPEIVFGNIAYGVGGDDNTINALNVDYGSGSEPYTCQYGPDMRMLIDMSDADKFYQSLACGQSGQFFSANENDQIGTWLRVDPMPIAFSQKQLEAQTQSGHKLILVNHN